MAAADRQHSLGDFARAGFQDLGDARNALEALAASVACPVSELLVAFGGAADPDVALLRIIALADAHPAAR